MCMYSYFCFGINFYSHGYRIDLLFPRFYILLMQCTVMEVKAITTLFVFDVNCYLDVIS